MCTEIGGDNNFFRIHNILYHCQLSDLNKNVNIHNESKIFKAKTIFTFYQIPRLMLRSWYPYDASHGMAHILTLIFQMYWLIFTIMDANLFDVLFCSWLLFACEQIQHLKNIMKPLMEFSATLDTVVPNSGELFKVPFTYLRETFKSPREIGYSNYSTKKKKNRLLERNRMK